ncbi:DNA topoisomerase iii [Cyclospora cayetanensis]|uniref:DNA topoisomerase n=1 Tax=Cyclospora cayetanensis TaxID=88456 RepID=A0A1D3DB46_9EIME|nr:DNA topoisomerase iii [Cyclospora cayetanensis]
MLGVPTWCSHTHRSCPSLYLRGTRTARRKWQQRRTSNDVVLDARGHIARRDPSIHFGRKSPKPPVAPVFNASSSPSRPIQLQLAQRPLFALARIPPGWQRRERQRHTEGGEDAMPANILKVLNVAEKPSVAKEITRLLGGDNVRRLQSSSTFNAVTSFPSTLHGRECEMIFTSVRGHLMTLDFSSPFSSWNAVPPEALFSAPVSKRVSDSAKDIVGNLKTYAKKCQWLVLWLDCDREGENIAFEVLQICKEANCNIQPFRAVFSAVTKQDVAADARSEIDLRIGAAFTRFLTKRYQSKLSLQRGLISYGPCQFPTLGFVVERFLEVEQFVSEKFWAIKTVVEREDDENPGRRLVVDFQWDRQRLFDRASAIACFELCNEMPEALITAIESREVTRPRPVPLSTVEMTKLCSRKLRIDSHRCMQLAEALYNRGYISYPRTETERFTRSQDLLGLIENQRDSPLWGPFAVELLEGGFEWPRDGPHDDMVGIAWRFLHPLIYDKFAFCSTRTVDMHPSMPLYTSPWKCPVSHPPIHPVKALCREDCENEDEWKVGLRELMSITIRNADCLAKANSDAIGFETKVQMDIAGRPRAISASASSGAIGNEANVHCLTIVDVTLHEGSTQPPSLLSEADLIDKMDKHGIGTDATMHEHIRTIQERNYAIKTELQQFKPTDLGVALVMGYKVVGRLCKADLSKPDLRASMERDMTKIARGLERKDEVVQRHVGTVAEVFHLLRLHIALLDEQIQKILPPLAASDADARVIESDFCTCAKIQGAEDQLLDQGAEEDLPVTDMRTRLLTLREHDSS